MQTIAVSPARHAAEHLVAHLAVAFAAAVAPLRMAEDHVRAAGILEHLGADIAGEGALLGRRAILPAERDAAAGERRPTSPISVAGGHTRMSQRALAPFARATSAPASAAASARSPFIFQLPATRRRVLWPPLSPPQPALYHRRTITPA